MIFWLDDLYMDDTVRKKGKKYKQIIEKRSFWQKLPWKRSFYLITLANNGDNLFEILNTDQMFFRYYEYHKLYVVGVAANYDSAVEILRKIMTEGYKETPSFDPRKHFTKDRFAAANEK